MQEGVVGYGGEKGAQPGQPHAMADDVRAIPVRTRRRVETIRGWASGDGRCCWMVPDGALLRMICRQVLEAVKTNRGTGAEVETIQMTFDEFKALMLSKGDLSAATKKRRRDTIKHFSISEVQTDENADQNV